MCAWVCVRTCVPGVGGWWGVQVQVSGTNGSIFIGLWKGGEFTLRDAPLSALFKALQSMKLPLCLSVFTHFVSQPSVGLKQKYRSVGAIGVGIFLCVCLWDCRTEDATNRGSAGSRPCPRPTVPTQVTCQWKIIDRIY